MSYEIAKDALNFKMPERIPYWGFPPFQIDFLRKVSGMDPFNYPIETQLKVIERCNMDAVFIFRHIPEKPEIETDEIVSDEKERKKYTRNLGWGKSEWREHSTFKTVEQVLEFDPLEYDTKTIGELTSKFKMKVEETKNVQEIVGNSAWIISPAEIYETLFMWPIELFGWEMFMITAMQEPDEFGRLLGRFAQISAKYASAWAAVDGVELFHSHDDLATTRGPVFNPEWYRRYIFPLYPKIWQPIKDKGIKVLFRGDGNMDEFVDDLVRCGADGFWFRRETNLKQIAEKYGKDKIIVGNISTQVLTFKGKEEIESEVKRCAREMHDCPGYFLNVAGDMPYNVPTENIEFLFEAIKKYGSR